MPFAIILLLGEDRSSSKVRGIGFYTGRPSTVIHGKYWRAGYRVLYEFERFLLCCAPYKGLILLSEICERASLSGIGWREEPSIEVSKAQKGLHLLQILRLLSTSYCGNLARVHCDLIWSNDEA